MNDRTIRLSALVIPFIAIGLIQYIQGYENWKPDVINSDLISLNQRNSRDLFPKNWNSPQKAGRTHGKNNVANITAREDDPLSKTFGGLGGGGDSKPAVIAYKRMIHNVSWAVTIPLFTFLLPTAGSGDPVNIANQAIYGVFAAIVTIIGFAIPILFNGAVPDARSLQNSKVSLNHLMHPGHLMNMVGANFQNQLGIDPMQCLQKTVCEANRSPGNERFGMLAYPFQYFFPANNVDDESARSIYEIAARDGKFGKTACGKKYECMFDVLDLASYFITVYKRAKARQALEQSTPTTMGDEDLETLEYS